MKILSVFIHLDFAAEQRSHHQMQIVWTNPNWNLWNKFYEQILEKQQ